MDTTPLPHWRRNIYLFLTSQFLSGITSMVVQYAIVWYLTKQTGSATVLSFATLLGMLPMVLLSPFVGPFVDRWNKKALLIIPDIIAAIFAIILSITGTLLPSYPLWLIFISLLVRSIAQTFQMPTIQSILPIMVPQKELTKINGQLGMVQSANMVIAPALGAFLFASVPINWLILLDVLGAAIGITLLVFVTIPEHPVIDEKVHVLADAKFGLDKLRQTKGLWAITMTGAAFTLMFMPAASLYPLMTMGYFHGNVGQAGLIEAIYSVGMLVGGTIIGLFGNWPDRMKPILWATVAMGITFGGSGLLPGNHTGFVWFVVLNSLAGVVTPFYSTLLMSMIQQSFPAEQLGRILGVLNSMMSITGPVGLIFAGPLADTIGVEKLFIIGGIGSLVCGFAMWIMPSARHFDQELQAKTAATVVEEPSE
ncbi:multidrug efflux pump protein [Levilactobacillus senmaizukei DSM 21775 = NBRC 103853]|uniref:Multidrug efflux pump protein n=1 Tax=Levilactobacillus senmaizukei DSM 21775 = NBRC 103853 TaxID=1423803 RepID=A0A0R2DE98_9LACO|nr:MFS transporter [Levilactobacillus senmaizukei]KRN02335.1 multidrug efflux pump protein [Levilactobacillus senmaizukei DSM 21775 = NBRC 103853]